MWRGLVQAMIVNPAAAVKKEMRGVSWWLMI